MFDRGPELVWTVVGIGVRVSAGLFVHTSPQQRTVPSIMRAQVWSFVPEIETTDERADPPTDSRTGVGVLMLPPTVPMPTCPRLLSPQQSTVPFDRSAHAAELDVIPTKSKRSGLTGVPSL
jgi:hypothetical protein